MKSSKRTIIFAVSFITTAITMITCSTRETHNSTLMCIETEKRALLALKKDLDDPSRLLSSWNASSEDCCSWEHVVCDRLTGHVREIHLRSPDPISRLRGVINPSLLNLKHLAYLDLSGNDFYESKIPSSIGSLVGLEYLNLSYSGFQGSIPRNFGNLSSLHALDLSGRYDEAYNFRWLSSLVHLEYLNLNDVDLSRASSWLEAVNKLPNLVELHLSSCNLDRLTPLYRLNFTSLEVLDLSNNNFNSLVPSWFFNLSNLVSLDLKWNNFKGPIPSDKNMAKLRYLDLSLNDFNCTLPYWLFDSYSLESVHLSRSMFSGSIPNTIGNLSSLRVFDLSQNEFEGTIQWKIGNICNLQTLDLSSNNFEGDFSGIFGSRMSRCFMASLLHLDVSSNSLSGELTEQLGEFQRVQYLNLGYNSFTGSIPFGLGNLSSLTILALNDNKFIGSIPSSLGLLLNLWNLDLGNNKLVGNIPFSFGQLVNLEELKLENNMLGGNIPLSLGRLSNLGSLYLENNMLEGIVTENHFSNLSKLAYLIASENPLTLRVGEDWNPPFQLQFIDLDSWNLGSQFPSWLRTQTSLDTVMLSNTGISGEIPTWFWSLPSLSSFNFSHNQLSGEIPHLISHYLVCLSSNNFSGPLPLISSFTSGLDLSNNSFSGGISFTLCTENNDLNRLAFLHLGRNDLSGEIPDCWMNWPSLAVLNLGNNNFYGKIPESFGLLSGLRSLNLYNNTISGEIPYSVRNCTRLNKIDLSGNKLEGNIPEWIGTSLSELRILMLRSNSFGGEIASEICRLRFLHILDIANNKFSGGIPSCLNHLIMMSSPKEQTNLGDEFRYYGSFIESASLTTKGSILQYDTILSLFNSIDLSNNQLSGNIPKELAALAGLRSLNLSGNFLSGSIPDNIGDMVSLESLDLSKNNLSGEIPIDLARLTALGYLNLSFNDLSGRIPQSTQLQSFNSSSFIGNELCGSPLSNNCNGDDENTIPDSSKNNKETSNHKGSEFEVDMWFYVCMSFGFIVGFWVWWLTLIFKNSWRYAYFKLLDDMWNKVYRYVS